MISGALQEPDSLDEAEKLHADSVEKLQTIQSQLGNKNMRANGERMTNEQYHAWRSGSMTSMRFTSEEVRFYKQKIQEFRRKESDNETQEKLAIAMGALADVIIVGDSEAGAIARRALKRLKS